MTKRILALLMVFTIITCLFSSCSDGTDEELYYPIYADPISFDPQIAADNASKIVVFNCFEGLVRLDENGRIVPGVAKSWQISPDGLTYTFFLRENSKWYMSEYAKKLLDEESAKNFNYNVVAEDFVYGIRRAFNPEMGASTDSRLYSIKNSHEVYSGEKLPEELGVTAINSTTLKIELNEADENFLTALTQSAAMPCREEFFEATKGRYGLDPEKVIYNGPFYLYSWSTGSHLTLFRNENYAGEKAVNPGAVYLYINGNLSTRTDKLVDGVYSACPFTVRQKEMIDNDDVSFIGYNNSTWGFYFNCAGEITQDYNIRSALASSLDVTQLPLPSHCKEYATGIVPQICMSGNSSYRTLAGKITPNTVNHKLAVKSLEQGFHNLGINNLSLRIVCHESFENIVKIAVQGWQSILGVHVNFIIEPLDDISLERKISSGEFDIAFTGLTASSESVVNFLGMFTSENPSNVFGFSSKKYDSLLKLNNNTSSQQSALTNCAKAEQHLTDMCVVIPVFSENSYLALAEKVTDIYCIEAGTVPVFMGGLKK